MGKFELQRRTMKFSVDVYFMVDLLPKSKGADNLSYQLLKSSSSVAANYRAACRAKSKADFLNKLKIVEEEADESLYWIEYMNHVKLVMDPVKHSAIRKEAGELGRSLQAP